MSLVLVVDDQPQIVNMTREILEFEGYAVQTAGSVAEALSAVQAQPPDVILCDWKLLDGTAGDVIVAISDIPIIVMSGSKPEDVVLEKAAGFLMKPCATPVLLSTLEQVLTLE